MTIGKKQPSPEAIKLTVVDRYGKLATGAASCCGWPAKEKSPSAKNYTDEQLASLPEASVAAMAGCGNPVAMALIKPGDTVLDLGSGGGSDVFLAAKAAGPTGRVIGIDMTPQMVQLARKNAAKLGVTNVQFRLAEIEAMPVPTDSVDVIISNCVINLVPDKYAALSEAFRVLKPGGRLAVSDIVKWGELPEEMLASMDDWAECLSGAISPEEYVATLQLSGFFKIQIQGEKPKADAEGWRKYLSSMGIIAAKPRQQEMCCG